MSSVGRDGACLQLESKCDLDKSNLDLIYMQTCHTAAGSK